METILAVRARVGSKQRFDLRGTELRHAKPILPCTALSLRAYSLLQVISPLNFAAIRSHLLPCICSLLSLWLSEVNVTPSFSIATRWKAKCACKVELHTSGRGSSGETIEVAAAAVIALVV